MAVTLNRNPTLQHARTAHYLQKLEMLYALFLKGEGLQGVFSLVKGTL